MFRINLFGKPQFYWNNSPLPRLQTPRFEALLSFVVLEGRSTYARLELARTFWPELDDGTALKNLRSTLYRLAAAFPEVEHYLHLDPERVHFRPERPFASDFLEVRTLLASPVRLESFDAVLQLARGTLVERLEAPWLVYHRVHSDHQLAHYLDDATTFWESRRDYARAIIAAERRIPLIPGDESPWRRLMTLHALAGDKAQVQATFKRCSDSMQGEGRGQLSLDTKQLLQQLLKAPNTQPSASICSSFLDRKEEWRILGLGWKQAHQNRATLTVVQGEPGIGKSTLVEQFHGWVLAQGGIASRARCHEGGRHVPYCVLAELLRQLPRQECPSQWKTELSRLLPEVLLEPGGPRPPVPFKDLWQRSYFIRIVNQFILSQGPVLLVIDDIQDCDPFTLTWLKRLLLEQPEARLMVAITFNALDGRSEPELTLILAELERHVPMEVLHLPPFEAETSLAFLQNHAQPIPRPEEAQQLHQQAGGNPLAMLELLYAQQLATKAGPFALRSSQGPLSRATHALLSRSSKPARELAQLLSVLDRHCNLPLLRAACPLEATLMEGLEELLDLQLVVEEPQSGYGFRYPALRSVVYDTLTSVKRRHLHRVVAAALTTALTWDELRSPALLSTLQRHLERADARLEELPEKAQQTLRTLLHPLGSPAPHTPALEEMGC